MPTMPISYIHSSKAFQGSLEVTHQSPPTLLWFKRVFPQMGRESNDSIAIQSSIALLQERFRQLEKVKEMREERELTRLLTEPKQYNPTLHYEPSRLYFHFLPPRSPPHVSLSLWPNSESKDADFQFMETPLLISLRPKETPTVHASTNKFDNSDFDDVDTSLHL